MHRFLNWKRWNNLFTFAFVHFNCEWSIILTHHLFKSSFCLFMLWFIYFSFIVWLIQCKVCMQTFMCTTSEVKCREHAEAKHPKSDVYACFPHLKKWSLWGWRNGWLWVSTINQHFQVWSYFQCCYSDYVPNCWCSSGLKLCGIYLYLLLKI